MSESTQIENKPIVRRSLLKITPPTTTLHQVSVFFGSYNSYAR